MKVLHLSALDHGGAAIGAIRIHEALLNKGVQSKILFLRNSNIDVSESYYISEPRNTLGIRLKKKIGVFPKFVKEKMLIDKLKQKYDLKFELFSSPFSLIDISKNKLVEDCDIINMHWIAGFIDYPSFFKSIKKPVIWTLHDMNPYMGGVHYDYDLIRNPQLIPKEKEYERMKAECVKRSIHAVVGNSDWNTRHAKESLIFSEALSFQTIYYPLSIDVFEPVKKDIAKNSLGLDNEKVVIGFGCDNLNNSRKGFLDLLKALNNLSPSDKSKIECITFGKINKNIEGLLPNIKIRNFGSQTNTKILSLIYSAMDFFVIPSKAEAFGLTSLEAMACQNPVIGNNIGGIPEMIIPEITGYLCEPEHIENLTNKISLLINDKDLRLRMGINAREYVRMNHNPAKIAQEYMDVYSKTISYK